MDSYVIEAIVIVALMLTGWWILHLAKQNRRMMPRWHSPCCLDVACSEMCARRQQALYTGGVIDGAHNGARVHELLRGQAPGNEQAAGQLTHPGTDPRQ